MESDKPVYQVLIRFEAQQEMQEAFEWYEDKARKLGGDFLRAVDERLDSIQRDPTAYPVIHKQVRRVLLRRFPYSLFYVVDGQAIIILACFHASRNPRQWQQRADAEDDT